MGFKHYSFLEAYTSPGAWVRNYNLRVDRNGKILAAGVDLKPLPGDQLFAWEGYLIPGFISAHSHAFQYAMAGLTEYSSAPIQHNNFWTWRDAMYKLALNIQPEQMRAIAAMVYSELLRNGVTNVCEFHYLHHDRNGVPYADKCTMSEQLLIAAKEVGINLSLVPVYYQRSDFTNLAKAEQCRFLHKNVDEYLSLCAALRKKASQYGASFGTGVHSLRAATPADTIEILNQKTEEPLHIHIAEQLGEVEQCLRVLQKRPVRWLLDNIAIDKRHILTHATHLVREEMQHLAQSGALTVLCPTTEANLGDGSFPFKDYLECGGKWAIGSDSQIGLNPCEELRWLDYQARLQLKVRNPLCNSFQHDSGSLLFDGCISGGNQAFGGLDNSEHFAVGKIFNGIVLDARAALLEQTPSERRLSTLIFAASDRYLSATISKGEIAVHQGTHRKDEAIRLAFSQARRTLINS